MPKAIRIASLLFGLVAQGLEQRTHNPLVVGSKPTRPTILKPRKIKCLRGCFVFQAVCFYSTFFGVFYIFCRIGLFRLFRCKIFFSWLDQFPFSVPYIMHGHATIFVS